MTLPYSPLQKAVPFVEEGTELAADLGDMPVVCCSLHSQVAPAVAGVGEGARVAYVQLAGGALPVSLSDSVRVLKERGLVEVAVGAGPCFDGDVQAVNVASALAWVRRRVRRRRLRRRSRHRRNRVDLGHGGVAAAEAANIASALNGSPVVAVRVSEGDPRERHRGVSHHTRAVLGLLLDEVAVAWPAGLEAPDWLSEREEVDVEGWRGACEGLVLEHMGRGADEDPVVLRVRLCGRQARAQPHRLMEERGLGPVVGLGTWNTFESDAELARAWSEARWRRAAACSTRRPCMARRRRSGRRSRSAVETR